MTAHTLLLRLRGPMQSWGDGSRFTVRDTASRPTKSGIVGLLAAAEGRRRSDSVEDLAMLRFGVRVDQPGTVMRDFQTAIDWVRDKSMPLVSRYYLADAVFLVGIEGPRPTLDGLAHAVKNARYPLYLGRRSCPANVDLLLGIRDQPMVDSLRAEPWLASVHHRKTRSTSVSLPIFRDALPGEVGAPVRDVPISFSQEHREYAWRHVVQEEPLDLDNPDGTGAPDPFFETVMSA